MTDDTFHLTPHDVRGQEFQRSFRGYDPGQVESFKERVADELDRVLRERAKCEERLKSMVEQLRSYRERDRALNEALVAAQQLREDIQSQAGREAEVLLAEARQEAARHLAQAEAEEATIRRRVEAVGRQLQTYIVTFRTILDRHQAELAGLESYLEVESSSQASEVPAS